MADARFIWVDAEGKGRNRWGLFRTTFELAAKPAGGSLNVFADTRYRLVVNGHVLGHGPARFFPWKPEYDTIDLAPALRQGRNAIALIVNSTGGVTFHSEPSVGGLIAWGEVRDDTGNVATIATDESWRAMESPGHRCDTHYTSFALNPAEQLDARRMPMGWEQPDFDDSAWPHAVLHARPDHWGPLQPRSIPLLDEGTVRPARRLGAWAAREFPSEEVHSLLAIAPSGKSLHTNARVAVMTFVHSPRDQETTFGAWWGKYWVNGEPVQATSRRDNHLRRDFPLRLRKGWNTLLVVEAVKHDWWDFYLALPRAAGLELSAEKEIGSPNTFLVGGMWEDALAEAADRVAWPIAEPGDLPEALRPWKPWPRDRKAETPCRERAWRTFERLEEHGQTSLPVAPTGVNTIALLFDFGGEVLGRPVLEFTAKAGTVVDVAYTERLKADGTADVHWRYFVDMMERYVARDGRQTWQTFHPRGFRYLEVLVKGDLRAFDLHGVSLKRASYPVRPIGAFECSDPLLNRIWALGPPTLRACMEDAYLDCPWRERGLYTGDFFVEFYSNLAAFGDTALFRRCIELFFQSQGDNGLIRPCPHGLPPGRHPDYSAILAQCLWHYWARTGDLAFLREMLPGLERLLAGLEALQAEGSELFDGSSLNPYVDGPHAKLGGVTCGLNCFIQRAFSDGARVLDLVGEAAAAQRWRERADRLAAAIRDGFWSEDEQAFVEHLPSAVPDASPSPTANALALLYDIAERDQVQPALDWLIGAMGRNLRATNAKGETVATVGSYFAFYALGALYKHGRAAEAEDFTRQSWGYILDRGAWTCWEHWPQTDSLCHAWSSAPTWFLSSAVLGIQFPEPGNPNVVRILPQPGTLQWARGVYPHPKGPLRVEWRREADKLRLQFECPEGVKVTLGEGVV
ncbi:MAG TPA: family 78 glycoside hydrolase catalytic domain [Planctomycetota bacterium]|nr:family 78 glycoside hydrolase catalytic domain [Planctomycetota bacterium]